MPREVTRMRDGFKVGDRVRWSLEGQQANLPGAGTGRVTGFGYRPGMLIVRPDGRKTASAYAIEFWELEKPEGGGGSRWRRTVKAGRTPRATAPR